MLVIPDTRESRGTNMQIKNQELEMKEEIIKSITVHHNSQDIIFINPAYGPNDYVNIKDKIERKGSRTSNVGELTSLTHVAFNSDDKYSREIRELMSNGRYLWGFTGSLYLPKGRGNYCNGAFIEENPRIIDGMPYMNKEYLIKRLKSNDPSVRFVPFGFGIGEMSSSELAKNPYVIALVGGEETAEKLAYIADKHNLRPHLNSLDSVEQELIRVSTLDSGLGSRDRLNINGYGRGYGRCGFGFRVKKTLMKPY